MDLVADENVPRAVIERLRADGHSVVAISEIAAGIADTAVATVSSSRAFLLITHDRDFGDLAVAQGLPVVGVILLETERLSLVAQAERISTCLSGTGTAWAGHLTVIEPARIRTRAL